MSLIGRSVKRLEDRPLLTGSGRFAADVVVPDMLYMRVVRSPVAFGRLTRLRIAGALAHPRTGGRFGPPHRPADRGGGGASRHGRGLDRARRRRYSPDRLSHDAGARVGALSPTGLGEWARALCRRADRGGEIG